MSFNHLVVFIAVFLSCSVYAESVSDIKMKFLQYMLECAEKHSVSTEDLKEITKHKTLKDDNAKCMLACTFKKTGMTDEDGKLSIEGIKQVAETAYADNPAKFKQSEEYTKACLRVNEEQLSGDKQECERAAMIFNCSVENHVSVNASVA